MSQAKISKTNALRLLDANKVSYKVHPYQVPGGFLDGMSIAMQLEMEPGSVYKTLVLQGSSKEHYVCVIPVDCELNLKKAARHFGEKKIDMLPVKNLIPLTGYVKGGCSPLGMKKLFRTAIARQAEGKQEITFNAGKVGLLVTMPLAALMEITGAAFGDLTA